MTSKYIFTKQLFNKTGSYLLLQSRCCHKINLAVDVCAAWKKQWAVTKDAKRDLLAMAVPVSTRIAGIVGIMHKGSLNEIALRVP